METIFIFFASLGILLAGLGIFFAGLAFLLLKQKNEK